MLGMSVGHAGDVENDAGDVASISRENAVKYDILLARTKNENKNGENKTKTNPKINPHPFCFGGGKSLGFDKPSGSPGQLLRRGKGPAQEKVCCAAAWPQSPEVRGVSVHGFMYQGSMLDTFVDPQPYMRIISGRHALVHFTAVRYRMFGLGSFLGKNLWSEFPEFTHKVKTCATRSTATKFIYHGIFPPRFIPHSLQPFCWAILFSHGSDGFPVRQ